jgi:hypothetical protein
MLVAGLEGEESRMKRHPLAGTYSRPAYNWGRLRMRPVATGSHDEHEGALA